MTIHLTRHKFQQTMDPHSNCQPKTHRELTINFTGNQASFPQLCRNQTKYDPSSKHHLPLFASALNAILSSTTHQNYRIPERVNTSILTQNDTMAKRLCIHDRRWHNVHMTLPHAYPKLNKRKKINSQPIFHSRETNQCAFSRHHDLAPGNIVSCKTQ